MKDMFLNWEGTYFSNFIEPFLHPLNGIGLFQLRIIMIENALLFVGAVSSFVYQLCKKEIISLHCKLLLIMCTFIGVLGFESWYQIFYWYTGAAFYTIPLSVLLIGLSMTMYSDKKIGYIISGVLLFLASGGNLSIAGMGCYLMLMIVVAKLYQRKLRKADVFIFIGAIAGALMNCLAPGNYVRHSVIDESGLHFFRAIIFSFSEVVVTVEWLFFDTPFLLVCIVVFFVGVCAGKKQAVEKIYSWLMIALSALIPIVTYFPVGLGYSSGGGPNRIRFILTFSVVVSIFMVLTLAGKVCAEYIGRRNIREVVVVVMVLVITMPTEREGWKLSETVPYHTLMDLTEGRIQSYYREANRIYDAIRTDENEDVFIYSLPEEVDGFLCMDIIENPNHLINSEVAQYFNKKSVQCVYSPVYVSEGGDTYVRISPSYFENDLSYVSIFKICDDLGMEEIQVLKPFEKNMVLQIPKGETGSVVVYIFADSKGESILEKREFSY